MPNEETQRQPDQTQTTPGGAQIPVPKKRDVLAALKKVSRGGSPADDDETPEPD